MDYTKLTVEERINHLVFSFWALDPDEGLAQADPDLAPLVQLLSAWPVCSGSFEDMHLWTVIVAMFYQTGKCPPGGEPSEVLKQILRVGETLKERYPDQYAARLKAMTKQMDAALDRIIAERN
jgi:hypothetical protein